MSPTPKSLILELLSTMGRHAVPVRALVAAAALFGIQENSLRVALARLLAGRQLERDGRGAYRVGERAQAINREIRSWRQIEDQLAPWNGDWFAINLLALSGSSGRARQQRDRALSFLGFRALAPGLQVRPANLKGGTERVRQRMASLGLEAPGLVFRVSELDAEAEEHARSLWDGSELVERYRAGVASLEESGRRLPGLSREEAMVESFLIGGAGVRSLVLDPLLPEPIVSAAERRALLDAMTRYDQLGRAAWSGWLGESAIEPAHAPVGVRGPRPGADVISSTQGA